MKRCAEGEPASTAPKRRRRLGHGSTGAPVRIAVYCSGSKLSYTVKTLNRIGKVVEPTQCCRVEQVSAQDIRDGVLTQEEYSVVYVPGGSVFVQQAELQPDGYEALLRFVHGGGGFFGICAGALLAGQESFDGCVSGTGMLGATTTYNGWERADGAWEAMCCLTQKGQAMLHMEDESEAAKVTFTGGSWHRPCAAHNSVLDVEVAPFEPVATFSGESEE